MQQQQQQKLLARGRKIIEPPLLESGGHN